MTKVYDNLMKSAKLTAAQNKDEGAGMDCIGKFVLMCEEKGFIPQYYEPEPQDRVDETLADTKRYLKTLVSSEMNLENLMNIAIKSIQDEEKETEEDAIDDIMNFDLVQERTLEDYEELQAFEESEFLEDEVNLNGTE